MGKSTEVDGDNNPTLSDSDPAKLLEAALLQMDGIIAGKFSYLQPKTETPFRNRNLHFFNHEIRMPIQPTE